MSSAVRIVNAVRDPPLSTHGGAASSRSGTRRWDHAVPGAAASRPGRRSALRRRSNGGGIDVIEKALGRPHGVQSAHRSAYVEGMLSVRQFRVYHRIGGLLAQVICETPGLGRRGEDVVAALDDKKRRRVGRSGIPATPAASGRGRRPDGSSSTTRSRCRPSPDCRGGRRRRVVHAVERYGGLDCGVRLLEAGLKAARGVRAARALRCPPADPPVTAMKFGSPPCPGRCVP